MAIPGGDLQRTFVWNVQCITKMHSRESSINGLRHEPVAEEVSLEIYGLKIQDLEITTGVVAVFKGQRYTDLQFRTGLDGTCLVICIHKQDEAQKPYWDLYTDLLTEKGLKKMSRQKQKLKK